MLGALLLVASGIFGAADQYLGSFPTLSWGASASLLSAPWLLIAFVAGWTQRTNRGGMVVGLACTYAALVGYGLMTLSPVEGAHLTWRTALGFCQSEAPVLVGGLLTGPLFGWFGHRWRVSRAWLGALLTAAAFCFEPLAQTIVNPGVISSRPVMTAEIAVGIALLGYVGVAVAHRRRPPA